MRSWLHHLRRNRDDARAELAAGPGLSARQPAQDADDEAGLPVVDGLYVVPYVPPRCPFCASSATKCVGRLAAKRRRYHDCKRCGRAFLSEEIDLQTEDGEPEEREPLSLHRLRQRRAAAKPTVSATDGPVPAVVRAPGRDDPQLLTRSAAAPARARRT